MPEIPSASATSWPAHGPSQSNDLYAPAIAPPTPPVALRSPAMIMAEVDGWVGMQTFKVAMHRLIRACATHQAMPGVKSAAYNLLLRGEAGVGKTSAAVRYAELLCSLRLSNGHLGIWSGTGPGDLALAAEPLCAQAAGGVLLIDDGHGITERFSHRCGLDAVFAALNRMARPPVLILCGEMSAHRPARGHVDLEHYFAKSNVLTLNAFPASQTLDVLERSADLRGYRIGRDAVQALRAHLPVSNMYQAQLWLDDAIIEHASRPRVRALPVLDRRDFASALEPPAKPTVKGSVSFAAPPVEASALEDLEGANSLPPPPPRRRHAAVTLPATATACKALAKVEALEGLEHVKQAMRDVYANALVGRARRARGLAVEPPVLHAAFTGNPGTGKTTVARLYGELLCELGLLGASGNGQVHEVDRSGLVGKYIGQTESKVSALLNKAKGGVLFIDEAHGLVPSQADDDKDFGRLALDLIVKFMEDRRHEIAIVLAGYADPMERLHYANPGLRSRLGQQLRFPDFDASALGRILQQELVRREYTLDAAAAKRICTKLIDLGKRDQTFANARSVRQVVDNAITVQSQRLSKTLHDDTGRDAMMQLVEADFFARDDGKPEKRDEPWRSMFI